LLCLLGRWFAAAGVGRRCNQIHHSSVAVHGSVTQTSVRPLSMSRTVPWHVTRRQDDLCPANVRLKGHSASTAHLQLLRRPRQEREKNYPERWSLGPHWALGQQPTLAGFQGALALRVWFPSRFMRAVFRFASVRLRPNLELPAQTCCRQHQHRGPVDNAEGGSNLHLRLASSDS